jgi:hypothetical protein
VAENLGLGCRENAERVINKKEYRGRSYSFPIKEGLHMLKQTAGPGVISLDPV